MTDLEVFRDNKGKGWIVLPDSGAVAVKKTRWAHINHGGTWPEKPYFGGKANPEFARATRESAWTPTEGELFWSDQAWDKVEKTGKGVDGFNAINYLRLQHYVSFSLAHSYSAFQGKQGNGCI